MLKDRLSKSKRLAVSQLTFWARNVFGTFEKRVPGLRLSLVPTKLTENSFAPYSIIAVVNLSAPTYRKNCTKEDYSCGCKYCKFNYLSFAYPPRFLKGLLLLFFVVGLKLNLYINSRQYVPHISHAGARVVILDQRELPFPDEEGINAVPGTSTTIGVRRVS